MPSSETFSIGPISDLLDRWLGGVVVDPFARGSGRATITNDLDPAQPTMYHLEAGEFCDYLREQGTQADVVLFDPPYSPRQIAEAYKRCGMQVGMEETQNGALYKRIKVGLDKILRPGGVAISMGWNSSGFGAGYELQELLLVAHGGAHNDTIVTVEVKRQANLFG